jgi:hypothetical protein
MGVAETSLLVTFLAIPVLLDQADSQHRTSLKHAGARTEGGQRFESPQLHQEVDANRRDFQVRRIARHSRKQHHCQMRADVRSARATGSNPLRSNRKSAQARVDAIFLGSCERQRACGKRSADLVPIATS